MSDQRTRSVIDRRPVALGLLGVMALVATVLMLIQASRDSPVFDEGPDMAGGVTAVVQNDLRISPEHPFPYKALAAVPGLLAEPAVPEGPAWETNEWFDYIHVFVRAQSDDRLRELLFLMRLLSIAATVCGGFLIYATAARLTSRRGALVSSALWFASPLALGYGHVLTPDAAFAFGVLLTVYALVRHVQRPSDRSIVFVGVALGVALSARHLGLALVPTALISIGILWRSGVRRKLLDIGIVLVVPVVTVWIAYRVLSPTGTSALVEQQFDAIIATAAREGLVERLALAIPFPLEYRAGLGFLFLVSEPKTIEVLGLDLTGSPLAVPIVLALQTPVPGALLIVAAVAGWVRGVGIRASDYLASVLPVTVIMPLAMILADLHASARVLLYLVGLLCLGACATAHIPVRPRVLGAGALAVLVGGHLVLGWSSHPHSIAWRTDAYGDASTDRYADFGQDLYRLERFAENEKVLSQVSSTRGFDVTTDGALLAADPAEVTGWVAVGLANLHAHQREELRWLRPYCHVDDIGGSILLYYFDEPPRRDVSSTDVGGRCDSRVSRIDG